MKKEKLKSELKRIKYWNINSNNIVTDVIETCKDKDGGYIPILIKQGSNRLLFRTTTRSQGKWKRILV